MNEEVEWLENFNCQIGIRPSLILDEYNTHNALLYIYIYIVRLNLLKFNSLLIHRDLSHWDKNASFKIYPVAI